MQRLCQTGAPAAAPVCSRAAGVLLRVLQPPSCTSSTSTSLSSSSSSAQRRGTSMRAAAAEAAAGGNRVIALDFDGVVCDSVGESSLSAFKAAAIQWPEVFATPAAEAAKAELVEKMRAVRPVVETGYENIVQIRCLYEGVSVQQMLDGWHEMLPAKMQEWGLDRSQLVHLFGSVRDGWIAKDLASWLAPNQIYPGVADAVKQALQQDDVYVVTTKQAHYTEVLLRDMAGIPFPADRIHSTTLSSEPKAQVLARLAQDHPGAASCVFVEDKLSTLEKVAKEPATRDWQLFLVDWGYNTQREREAAHANPRITVVDLAGFQRLLGGSSTSKKGGRSRSSSSRGRCVAGRQQPAL